jgi:deferrochelatase/peroxidase EfeB
MTMQQVRIDLDNTEGIGPESADGPFSEEHRLLMEDIQGNILKSHGRDHSRHLFIRFDPAKRREAKAWLTRMADEVTSAMEQWEQSRKRAEVFASAGFGPDAARRSTVTLGGTAGLLGASLTARVSSDGDRPMDPESHVSAQLAEQAGAPFVCLMLSKSGYDALGLEDKVPQAPLRPDDDAFRRGTRHPDTLAKLTDRPVDEWEEGFVQDLHALVIVADDSPLDVLQKADEIQASLESAGIGRVVHHEIGKVLRLRPNGPACEHFGFADGVSQPLFLAKDLAKQKPKDGKEFAWTPFAPLNLVLAKDPGGDETTGYGSFFVYRKLEQDVPGFDRQCLELAKALAEQDGRDEPHEGDKELAGAYIMGRFRNGRPVNLPATAGGDDDPLANDFVYEDSDPDGLKCPYQAHTRKTNPRGDSLKGPLPTDPPTFEQAVKDDLAARIARRGISYESDSGVGLLFLCAQADIAFQFEFMQQQWCNHSGFLTDMTGPDPVVGRCMDEVATKWPKKYGSKETFTFNLAETVTLRGAEYFFAPSLSCLRSATV